MDIKNKAGEILGTYELTVITKAETYTIPYTNKAGTELTLVKDISKEDILKLASQAFNTNVRNYVAGLARPKTGSKLSAYEEFFASKGIDTKGIPVEKLIEKLKDMTE